MMSALSTPPTPPTNDPPSAPAALPRPSRFRFLRRIWFWAAVAIAGVLALWAYESIYGGLRRTPRIVIAETDAPTMFRWWIGLTVHRDWETTRRLVEAAEGLPVRERNGPARARDVMTITGDRSATVMQFRSPEFDVVGNREGHVLSYAHADVPNLPDKSRLKECLNVTQFVQGVRDGVIPTASRAQLEKIGDSWLLLVVWETASHGMGVFYLNDQSPVISVVPRERPEGR